MVVEITLNSLSCLAEVRSGRRQSPVNGRKNWIRIGSKGASPKIAAALAIFAICKRLAINIRN